MGINMNKRIVGSRYEQEAAEYLKSQGYRILMMNYRCRLGEIDIVAMDGNTLVFCEVKYRKSLRYGSPAEAVDLKKQNRIERTTGIYLMEHSLSPDIQIRFDVVAILNHTFTLYKNAFGGL